MSNAPVYSLGVLQEAPTQFDDPVFRLAAGSPDIRLTVYYYGGPAGGDVYDAEIGRRVSWREDTGQGYRAVFRNGENRLAYVRRILGAGHHLIIVSGYNRPIPLMTTLGGRIRGVPIGLRSDNVLPSSGARKRFWAVKKLLFPLWFRIYTTGHPVGENAAAYLARFGFAARRLFRFPYCMDGDALRKETDQAKTDRASLRKQWGLAPDARVICGVIKFSDREDPVTLVRAARQVRESDPSAVLLLVGDGPLREAVKAAAGEELGKGVVLTGYLPFQKLPEIYAVADVFVHPAAGAWEVSVAEALASGLPVVAADSVGSAAELVLPRRLGYLFPRGDGEQLAQRIANVLNDPDLIERSRREGLMAVTGISPLSALQELKRALEFVGRARLRSLDCADGRKAGA